MDVKRSNAATSGNTFPANFAAATGSGFSFGSHNPSFPTCPGPYAINHPFRGTSCGFDPSPLVSLLPESEPKGIFGPVRYAFASDLEVYCQFSYYTKEQRSIIQPGPISDQFHLPP